MAQVVQETGLHIELVSDGFSKLFLTEDALVELIKAFQPGLESGMELESKIRIRMRVLSSGRAGEAFILIFHCLLLYLDDRFGLFAPSTISATGRARSMA